jgi:hypothetical protein
MKEKLLALLESGLAFAGAAVIFNTGRAIPLDLPNSRLLAGYGALLVLAAGLYAWLLRRQPAAGPGAPLRSRLEAAGQGFFPIFALSLLLGWVNWREWPGALLIAAAALGLLALFGRLARGNPATPLPGSAAAAIALLPAAQIGARLGAAMQAFVYAYLIVALSEELLFRGFIQTRLNAAFGRPRRFFGIPWGWGLVIAAGMFGLWHAAAQPAAPSWPQVLWTAFAGLLLGMIREKAGGVAAPALLHGVLNFGPQALLFLLIWG